MCSSLGLFLSKFKVARSCILNAVGGLRLFEGFDRAFNLPIDDATLTLFGRRRSLFHVCSALVGI